MNKHSFQPVKVNFSNSNMKGDGLIKMTDFPPKTKKLLEEIKDEPIKEMILYRYALPDVSAIAKIASLGKVPYDNLMHLGIYINNKYRLDKDALLTFEKAPFPDKSKKVESLKVQFNDQYTIGEAWDKLKSMYSTSRIFDYDALTQNCQVFVMDFLSVFRVDKTYKKWVMQDLDLIKKSLPGFAQGVAGTFNDIKLFLWKLTGGKGEPDDDLLQDMEPTD